MISEHSYFKTWFDHEQKKRRQTQKDHELRLKSDSEYAGKFHKDSELHESSCSSSKEYLFYHYFGQLGGSTSKSFGYCSFFPSLHVINPIVVIYVNRAIKKKWGIWSAICGIYVVTFFYEGHPVAALLMVAGFIYSLIRLKKWHKEQQPIAKTIHCEYVYKAASSCWSMVCKEFGDGVAEMPSFIKKIVKDQCSSMGSFKRAQLKPRVIDAIDLVVSIRTDLLRRELLPRPISELEKLTGVDIYDDSEESFQDSLRSMGTK